MVKNNQVICILLLFLLQSRLGVGERTATITMILVVVERLTTIKLFYRGGEEYREDSKVEGKGMETDVAFLD